MSTLPIEARAALARCLLALGAQHAARTSSEPCAALVIVEGRDVELPPAILGALHDAGRGHRCAVVDLLWIRALVAVEHPDLASALNGPTSTDEAWCLVLGRDGAVVVPVLLAAASHLSMGRKNSSRPS